MRLVYKGLKVISGRKLAANKAGIERAGEPGIRSSLHQRAAIREDGEGVLAALEAQQQSISPDLSQRAEACRQRGEIDGAIVLVDLHGVAAAEGDVGAGIAGERTKITLAADLAAGARMGS